MRKCLKVFALTLACALWVNAQEKQKPVNVQTKPDFSGNWLLDRVKSNAGLAGKPDLPLNITYRDPEIRITYQHDERGKIVGRDFVYYTDGRGETNPATRLLTTTPNSVSRDLDKQVSQSKTRWSGNKLVMRATLRTGIAGRVMEFEVIDEWRISGDGKTLTQTSRTVIRQHFSDGVFVPANAPDLKKVYNRIP